jgi:hypothetical protein
MVNLSQVVSGLHYSSLLLVAQSLPMDEVVGIAGDDECDFSVKDQQNTKTTRKSQLGGNSKLDF